ncbi:Hsp20/alpha crystallin family protein [Candidatus Phytoplasma sacchari]|uniref:Hsp20/alpha crystallin family protein n=1 Tax=Candidatus Phytoplasma sacchari TaxID=2609813 RepID=A0ABY7M1G8_9MOLU|nr:Hsp20/alpha crystallin family protein [Candidatus Phytoplasma sacchari]
MFLDLISHNNSLLEDLFDDLKSVSLSGAQNNPMPIDIIEKKDHYLLIANVPGLMSDEVKVSLENNRLTIEAIPNSLKNEEENKKNDEQIHYLRQERPKFIVKRSFKISDHLKSEDIQCNFYNGVLEIKINKTKEEPITKKYININNVKLK